MKLTKNLKFTASLVAGTLGINTLNTTSIFASDICSSKGATDEAKNAAGCNGSGNLTNSITSILKAIIGVIGLVAVVFIIIGGVNYMTSNGDPQKTKKAKDTILYAAIGLIICALAFAIVNFVIGNILG